MITPTPCRIFLRLFQAVFACGLGLSLAASIRAQVGPFDPYVLTAGDQGNIHIVQGNAVTASFAAGTTAEYPIAVFDTVIRTTQSSASGTGREYTLGGVPTGAVFTLPSGIGSVFDGTTDGNFNYVVSYTLGNVYRLNLDFTNPVQLFASAFGSSLSITYDATDNSIWLASWSTNTVANYSMGGTVLSTFSATVVGGSLSSLALDPTTGTLWMGSQSTQGTFYEYSKTGVLLQTVAYPSLVSQNTLGGEFALAPVPEPGSWALFALGAAMLARPWRLRGLSNGRSQAGPR
ncbi:MAG: hypothetical protein A3G75_04995 [Verrucomicrobia bacterium RIFCSPLOWO2_12_FULL_64_8]|nr:MAG: hypothetical protein A3G75_04995 [Verrucomicrobia bacterium RIFCSPLOWO2_12_FULL_64_8]